MKSRNREDLFLIFSTLEKLKISFIKDSLYYYIRRNNNSITYKYIENMYEKGWEIHWLLESF